MRSQVVRSGPGRVADEEPDPAGRGLGDGPGDGPCAGPGRAWRAGHRGGREWRARGRAGRGLFPGRIAGRGHGHPVQGHARGGTAVDDGGPDTGLLHQRADERERVAGLLRRIRLPGIERRGRRDDLVVGHPLEADPDLGQRQVVPLEAPDEAEAREVTLAIPRGRPGGLRRRQQAERDVVTNRPRGHVREAGQVAEAVRVVRHGAILTLLPCAVKTSRHRRCPQGRTHGWSHGEWPEFAVSLPRVICHAAGMRALDHVPVRLARIAAPLLVATALVLPAAAPVAAAEPDWPASNSGYHNWPELVDEIQQAAVDYPSIVSLFSIGKSARGLRHLDGQGQRQRRRGRGGAGGPGRRPASRTGAPDDRAGARAPRLADARLRDGRDRDTPRGHARGVHHLRPQPRRHALRPHRHAVPGVAQEPAARRRRDRHVHGPQPQLRIPLGLLPAARRATGAPSRTAARPRSPRPRRAPCATSSTGAW